MISLGLSHIGRRAVVVAGGVVLVSTVACSDDATAPRPVATPTDATVDAPNLGKNPVNSPVVDGVITPGEYKGAATIQFRVLVPTPDGATPATVYVTHDQKYLYLATTFDRKSPFHPFDMVAFEFDNDNDGIREDGDDIVASDANSPQNTAHLGADFYRFNGGASNQSDPVINSISAWGAVGTTGVFEIRHELNSTDNAHDFSIVPTQTVGMIAQVSLETDPVGSGVYLHTLKPSFTTYCQLTVAKKTTSVTCP